MAYFNVQDLIGRNSKEAYDYYIFLIAWLTKIIPPENWELDFSYMLCINGRNIACGIRIKNFVDASKFCWDCV